LIQKKGSAEAEVKCVKRGYCVNDSQN